MRIHILGDISGTRNGKPWPKRGAVVDIPDGEGEALIGCGMAERVQEPPPVEQATRRKAGTETR